MTTSRALGCFAVP